MEFVLRYRSGSISMAALCRVFGISRQTGHKWVDRFSPRRGEASLEDLSRRPQPGRDGRGPRQPDVARRKQFPTWGARKILWLLQLQWPQVR